MITSVPSPTGLAFTPDGRLLLTTAPGRLRVYQDGALIADPALDISGKVCINGGRGLLGVAVDPNFATNHYIYLYYTTYGGNGPGSGGGGGEVRRIAYTGAANRSPITAVSADPTSGPLPLAVTFDGSGSSDPDTGDTLTYLWDFDDGTTSETTAPTTGHTYSTKGTYTASLRVSDLHGAISEPQTLRIDAGNVAPVPTIETPSAELLFGVGQQITLSGSATDAEDGQLPDGSLSWEVLQHHDGTHTHPVLSETGNDLAFAAPMSKGLASTGAGNYLEVRLTATDSEGLSTTVTREVQPHRVMVTFASEPGGLSLLINGQAFATPETLISWEGYTLDVDARSPQGLSGKSYAFASWSDGEDRRREVLTGSTPSSYTATYEACTKSGTSASETLVGTSAADIICGMGGDDTIEGMGGKDILLGGEGADTVKGNAGADDLYGNKDNDALDSRDGVSGNDSLDGGAGTDTKTTDATEKSIVGFP